MDPMLEAFGRIFAQVLLQLGRIQNSKIKEKKNTNNDNGNDDDYDDENNDGKHGTFKLQFWLGKPKPAKEILCNNLQYFLQACQQAGRQSGSWFIYQLPVLRTRACDTMMWALCAEAFSEK